MDKKALTEADIRSKFTTPAHPEGNLDLMTQVRDLPRRDGYSTPVVIGLGKWPDRIGTG